MVWLLSDEMTKSEGESQAIKAKGLETGLDKIGSDNASSVALRTPKLKRVNAGGYKRGITQCEHCNWTPPEPSMLHAHHVIPLGCGGPDTKKNIIVLCPNCHAVAHWVTKRPVSGQRYSGPTTRAALQAWMRHDLDTARKRYREELIASARPILAAMRA